jgi:hypothetical protein
MAGIRVSAAATDTTPTITAPAARLRRTLVGTRNSPSSAMTKVVPLKSTARLAVAPVRAMALAAGAAAAGTSRPPCSCPLSPQRPKARTNPRRKRTPPPAAR